MPALQHTGKKQPPCPCKFIFINSTEKTIRGTAQLFRPCSDGSRRQGLASWRQVTRLDAVWPRGNEAWVDLETQGLFGLWVNESASVFDSIQEKVF